MITGVFFILISLVSLSNSATSSVISSSAEVSSSSSKTFPPIVTTGKCFSVFSICISRLSVGSITFFVSSFLIIIVSSFLINFLALISVCNSIRCSNSILSISHFFSFSALSFSQVLI